MYNYVKISIRTILMGFPLQVSSTDICLGSSAFTKGHPRQWKYCRKVFYMHILFIHLKVG